MPSLIQRLFLRQTLRRTEEARAEARAARRVAIKRLQEVTRPTPEPVPAISFEHALDCLIEEATQERRA